MAASCAAITAAVLISSCATNRPRPAPPGMAVIDARADDTRRDRVGPVRFVSVNGSRANTTRAKLAPGRNTVRLEVKWPQGGKQQADLRFHATAGTRYSVIPTPSLPM